MTADMAGASRWRIGHADGSVGLFSLLSAIWSWAAA